MHALQQPRIHILKTNMYYHNSQQTIFSLNLMNDRKKKKNL